VLDCE
jgi:hypothetical protein